MRQNVCISYQNTIHIFPHISNLRLLVYYSLQNNTQIGLISFILFLSTSFSSFSSSYQLETQFAKHYANAVLSATLIASTQWKISLDFLGKSFSIFQFWNQFISTSSIGEILHSSFFSLHSSLFILHITNMVMMFYSYCLDVFHDALRVPRLLYRTIRQSDVATADDPPQNLAQYDTIIIGAPVHGWHVAV